MNVNDNVTESDPKSVPNSSLGGAHTNGNITDTATSNTTVLNFDQDLESDSDLADMASTWASEPPEDGGDNNTDISAALRRTRLRKTKELLRILDLRDASALLETLEYDRELQEQREKYDESYNLEKYFSPGKSKNGSQE